MHLEVLAEDASGKIALQHILPGVLGPHGQPHTWNVISYKGVGHIPRGLTNPSDASKRMLLAQLPRLLQGYGRSLGSYPDGAGVLVVVDSDRKDCVAFKKELADVLKACSPRPKAKIRIAVEEIEAWFLGDVDALRSAYPDAKQNVLRHYKQDSVCGTWERLADAIHPGGADSLRRLGYPHIGIAKCAWAETIAPKMVVKRNRSPSYRALVRSLCWLVDAPGLVFDP